jgi:transposase
MMTPGDIDRNDHLLRLSPAGRPRFAGRPGYHPRVMLKLYIYGYLNRVPSSRRLEQECQRNIEMIWLTGRLTPDFKTIADFREDNGKAIRGLRHRIAVPIGGLELREIAGDALVDPLEGAASSWPR